MVALACAATLLRRLRCRTHAHGADVRPHGGHRRARPPPGHRPAGQRPAASLGKTQALATFPSTRTGQIVQLQRDSGSGWQTVARGKQHRSGSTIFTLPDTTSLYRAVALSRAGAVVAATDTVRGRRFRTLFKDEFSGRRVDSAKWSDQQTLAPAYMRMCSRLSPRARTVGDGVLQMGVAPDPDPRRLGLHLEPQRPLGLAPLHAEHPARHAGKFDFTYGFAAARMKFHLDKGMHASFWLQPANWYTPGDPSRGTEIDVVEFFGRTKKDSHIAAFVHWYDTANAHHKLGSKFPYANRLKKRTETWSSSYHVFSVEWTPDAYVFRVDGREFWRETGIVSRAPEYLLLSMLTSDYELEKLTPGR